MNHTAVLPAIAPVPPLLRKRSPDGASPDCGCGHLITAYYSLVYTEKDKRLSRPGWLTYSGRSDVRTDGQTDILRMHSSGCA